MKIKNEKKYASQGITLIALIITIIVLLILAGITLNMVLGEHGIFKTAENAGKKYSFEADKEKLDIALIDLKIQKLESGEDLTLEEIKSKLGDSVKIIECDEKGNEKTANLTKKFATTVIADVNNVLVYKHVKVIFLASGNWYVINLHTGNVTWTSNGAPDTKEDVGEKSEEKDITIDYKGVKLKVGDYVEYTPVSKSQSANYVGHKTVTFNYEPDMKWRVLGLTTDGKLELISATSTKNYMDEDTADYNNHVYYVDNICNTLYGNDTNGSVARGLKIEDIEKTMDLKYWNYNEFVERSTGYKYEEKVRLDQLRYAKIFAQTKGNTVDGIEGTLKISEQNELVEYAEGEFAKELNATDAIIMTQTYWSQKIDTPDYFVNPIYYELFIPKGRGITLSSRCNGVNVTPDGSTYVMCSIRNISTTPWIDAHPQGYDNMGLRPVVTLGANLEIKPDTVTQEHNTVDTAWKIQ